MSNRSSAKKSAVIIAGAAAKGPFAAGALTQIAQDPRFLVRHVVGASSGALNAAVYAAGLRCGQGARAAELLCTLWRERAAWWKILGFGARVALVEDALKLFRDEDSAHPVHLSVVVASLPGYTGKYQYLRFEHVEHFGPEHFTKDDCIRRIAELCIASAAIPVIFTPRKVAQEGPYWDGGIVNNTPIAYALKTDTDIDHLLVVTPDSTLPSGKKWYGRFSVGPLMEMVVEERLARDLSEARSFNQELERLVTKGIDLDTLFEGENKRWRFLQFVEVRPDENLKGNALSGFFSRKTREQYIQLGSLTAQSILEHWSPQAFPQGPPSGEREAQAG